MSLFSSGTKNPLRKTQDILTCEYLSKKKFVLEMEEEGKSKRLIYEVKTTNIRNEIVSKIKYIIVSILLL